MSELQPPDAARSLGVSVNTLRKWAREFAPFLSESAQGGPTARRIYQDADILVLQHAGSLLAAGATYEAVRQALMQDAGIPHSKPFANTSPVVGDVMVIEPSDQAHALAAFVEAQRQLIESQRQHIDQQHEQIESLAAQLDQQRNQTKEDRDALLLQLDQQRQQAELERSRLAAELEKAKGDEAAALADLRRMLEKIPRWLRALLGLGA